MVEAIFSYEPLYMEAIYKLSDLLMSHKNLQSITWSIGIAHYQIKL